jgi:predicted Zn-dependent protease
MRIAYLLYVGIISLAAACDLSVNENPKELPKKMEYSYDCLDSAVGGSETSKAISNATSIIRNLAIKQKEITDSVQNQWGAAFHEDAIETKTFDLINDPVITIQLQKVMNDLLAVRENPSHIRYSIYLLNDSALNAFTFGGHEIGHSEKGHIKKTIQEMMISDNVFGEDKGASAYQVLKMLTGAFNQKNELEADYYGIDLAYQLNKNVCATVNFWNELSKSENQYNKLEDLFRTHPFSKLRAKCLTNHIQTNFHQKCG